jgi:hypothetical protein
MLINRQVTISAAMSEAAIELDNLVNVFSRAMEALALTLLREFAAVAGCRLVSNLADVARSVSTSGGWPVWG